MSVYELRIYIQEGIVVADLYC